MFLDEIAELPADLQAKLLRAIQEKQVRPVGDTIEHPIDVRLISATHQDLKSLIEQGKFREDFYYRINVIPIQAPSLREHDEDIPLIARSLVKKMAKNMGVKPPLVEREAVDKLKSYAFPGNVRELENILERSLALMESDSIRKDDIDIPEQTRESTDSDSVLDSTLPIDDHVTLVETERIKEALAKTDGNITAAADLLGTSFRSLRYRIKKLGIKNK